MKTHVQKKWESANEFLLWEAKQKEDFSSKFFSVKKRWWGNFLRNANFVKFRNASELSWKTFCS